MGYGTSLSLVAVGGFVRYGSDAAIPETLSGRSSRLPCLRLLTCTLRPLVAQNPNDRSSRRAVVGGDLHRQKLGPWASIATAIISFCIQLAGPIIGMTVAARSLYLIPNSSANPSAKFRARPAETMMP